MYSTVQQMVINSQTQANCCRWAKFTAPRHSYRKLRQWLVLPEVYSRSTVKVCLWWKKSNIFDYKFTAPRFLRAETYPACHKSKLKIMFSLSSILWPYLFAPVMATVFYCETQIHLPVISDSCGKDKNSIQTSLKEEQLFTPLNRKAKNLWIHQISYPLKKSLSSAKSSIY